MIILSDPKTQISVQLSPDDGWRWIDEFGWLPVKQGVTRTLTGAAIVQTGVMTGGRPITLSANDSEKALINGADAEKLAAWASVPGKEFSLALRGTTRTVIFRHQDAPALEIAPVVDYADPEQGDLYFARIKLMEL